MPKRISRYFSPITAQQAPAAPRQAAPSGAQNTASVSAQANARGTNQAIAKARSSVTAASKGEAKRLRRSHPSGPRATGGGSRGGEPSLVLAKERQDRVAILTAPGCGRRG